MGPNEYFLGRGSEIPVLIATAIELQKEGFQNHQRGGGQGACVHICKNLTDWLVLLHADFGCFLGAGAPSRGQQTEDGAGVLLVASSWDHPVGEGSRVPSRGFGSLGLRGAPLPSTQLAEGQSLRTWMGEHAHTACMRARTGAEPPHPSLFLKLPGDSLRC